jgi:hypothetical protein
MTLILSAYANGWSFQASDRRLEYRAAMVMTRRTQPYGSKMAVRGETVTT